MYLLIWPTWGCTAGQRIVLFLSVPNRHNYNFGRVCPKQGILISCESVPPKVRCLFLMFITAVCFLFLVKLRWLKRQEYLRFMIISGLCWERRCHTGRFATTIFNATHLATLSRHYFEWLQHSCNIATLCCAKNRRCESSLVTSPLDKLPARYKRALAFLREIGYPLLTHWIPILLNKVAFHFRTKNREIGSVIRSCEAVRKDKKIVRLTAESWALACLRPYFITSFGP